MLGLVGGRGSDNLISFKNTDIQIFSTKICTNFETKKWWNAIGTSFYSGVLKIDSLFFGMGDSHVVTEKEGEEHFLRGQGAK